MSRIGSGQYPAPPGSQLESIATHAGPATYTVLTPGSPPTGGDTLEAVEFGLKFFDSVEVLGYDATGGYTAMPVWDLGITEQPTSVKLIWFTNALVEVVGGVALSAKVLRIRATGQ